MQLTIRGLPPEMEDAVRSEARKERTSLNKAVIGLLEKALGKPGPREQITISHDLDRFCGAWTDEEASELENRFRDNRKIDMELWD
ncbi:MAG: hypothetical protein P1S46_10635 [bacterium]|nr:hypothetical protein [bacterium]